MVMQNAQKKRGFEKNRIFSAVESIIKSEREIFIFQCHAFTIFIRAALLQDISHFSNNVSKRKMFPHLGALWQIKFCPTVHGALRPKYKLIIHSLSESKLSFKLLIQTLKCSYIVSIRYICIYIHLYTPTNRPIWENTITT